MLLWIIICCLALQNPKSYVIQNLKRKAIAKFLQLIINCKLFCLFSLICYELPSEQTLEIYLNGKGSKISERTVCLILHHIVQALNYLSSKDIVHDAIVPKNILIVMSSQVGTTIMFQISSVTSLTVYFSCPLSWPVFQHTCNGLCVVIFIYSQKPNVFAKIEYF